MFCYVATVKSRFRNTAVRIHQGQRVTLYCSMFKRFTILLKGRFVSFCFAHKLRLTLFSLALFESVVDVYEGEVIAFRVLELSVTLDCLVGHASRWLQEATWR